MKVLRYAAPIAAALLGCGTIDMSPEGSAPASFRDLKRVFINDSAANDSLPGAWARDGVKFVLQPGKAYELRLATTAFAGDRMGFYLWQDGIFTAQSAVRADSVGGEEIFRLQTFQFKSEFFVGRLLTNNAAAAAARLGRTRLIPLNPVEGVSMGARLLVVGGIRNLPDGNAMDIFRIAFFDTLSAIFNSYGIALQTSYEYVTPTAPPMALAFDGNFHALAGSRVQEVGARQTVHLYLVDSIYIPGAPASSGTVLGFAPREAMDMSTDGESRVVLSARGGSPSRMATTAAHELGHFFGLRHPTATTMDLGADDDLSNGDDGFSSTTFCTGLTKQAAAAPFDGLERAASGPGGRPYCLFIAGPACPRACDLTNLMFPYECIDSTNTQRVLTGEQQTFVRRNLGLLQGL